MHSPQTATVGMTNTVAPVELHYVEKVFINSGEATTALCGESMIASNNTKSLGTGTSYTCPDCMLRYSMLGGAENV
ncbi:hypothetical protein [Glutamicibacter sp. M10]|uniref:hypothetical protein n=1 Tax=Glutamicibacter sp. M10 TaxID=3023076 RepID=UPI0021C90AA3|nr:hypothetical protein [Glutamicibacter sp. M10]UXN30693.1 hypothetical protein N6V40_09460 [Glutamicibacter sp. M10]